jgi:tetratricopeptide (TPR) repeat protein
MAAAVVSTVTAVLAVLLTVMASAGSWRVWSGWTLLAAIVGVGTIWGLWSLLSARFFVIALSACVVLPFVVGGGALAFDRARHEVRCERAKERVELAEEVDQGEGSRARNRAMSLFTEAIQLCPSGPTLFRLGQMESATQQNSAALRHLTEAIDRLDPSSQKGDLRGALLRRGIVHNDLGECDRAIVDLKAAMRLDPSFAPAHHQLVISRAGQGLLDNKAVGGALQHADEAVGLNRKAPDFRYVRGEVYLALGRAGAARTDLQAAINYSGPENSGIKQSAQQKLAALRSGQPPRNPFDPCKR